MAKRKVIKLKGNILLTAFVNVKNQTGQRLRKNKKKKKHACSIKKSKTVLQETTSILWTILDNTGHLWSSITQ